MPQRFSNLNKKIENNSGRFSSLTGGQNKTVNISDILKETPAAHTGFETPTKKIIEIGELDIQPFSVLDDPQKIQRENIEIATRFKRGDFEPGNFDAVDLFRNNITKQNSKRLIIEQKRQQGLKEQERQTKRDTAIGFAQELKESQIDEFIPIVSSISQIADVTIFKDAFNFINEHKNPVPEDYKTDRQFILPIRKYTKEDL